jgi:hypothetical protein
MRFLLFLFVVAIFVMAFVALKKMITGDDGAPTSQQNQPATPEKLTTEKSENKVEEEYITIEEMAERGNQAAEQCIAGFYAANKGLAHIDLEELARQGNVNAALCLADFFFANRNAVPDNNGVNVTLKWYEVAAERDVYYAVMQAVHIRSFIAMIDRDGIKPKKDGGLLEREEDEPFYWELALEDHQYAYRWCTQALMLIDSNAPDAKPEDRDSIVETMSEISYWLGVCYYMKNQYGDAFDVAHNLTDTKSRVLCAVSRVFAAEEREIPGALKEAYPDLCRIETDPTYAESQKKGAEEDIYMFAAMMLANERKDRALDNKQEDYAPAVLTLKKAKNAIKKEKCKQLLQKELDHYQLNYAGKYIYIA